MPASYGKVWHDPEQAALVFLLLASDSPNALPQSRDRVQASLVLRVNPRFHPQRPARELRATVPADWILTVDDPKKQYWADPKGGAFFMISKGTDVPFDNTIPGYGMKAGMAEFALKTAEILSGRKPDVHDSKLVFSDRLFVVVSRARAHVPYKSGTFEVEMDMWYDPRLQDLRRVYLGGATAADLAAARAIRESLAIE